MRGGGTFCAPTNDMPNGVYVEVGSDGWLEMGCLDQQGIYRRQITCDVDGVRRAKERRCSVEADKHTKLVLLITFSVGELYRYIFVMSNPKFL